jgi:RNA-binding protein
MNRAASTRSKTDASPAPKLSARRKQDLRAQAHHLQPLVQIGHGGLHEAAFEAVALALRDHELIKVRLHEPEDKRAMAEALAERARAALCGLVGHTVILYKPKPEPEAKPQHEDARRERRGSARGRTPRSGAARSGAARSGVARTSRTGSAVRGGRRKVAVRSGRTK